MNLRKRAVAAAEHVTEASRQVGTSAQYATVVLALVAAVAVVALLYSTAALREVRHDINAR